MQGMFSPDREPHPSVSEIKYLQQPAAVTLPNAHLNLVIKVPDSSKRIPAVVPDSLKEQCHIQLKVVNRYAFSDLSHLVWKWKIILEFHPNADLHGFATLVDETLSIDCSSILHNLFDLAPPMVIGDVFLNIEGVLLSDQSWANAGHRVVSEQLPMKLLYESLSLQHHPLSKSMSRSSLAVVEDSSSIYVSNDMSRPSVVVIDKKTGGINAIKLDGRNILHGHGIQPNFTRASTDNDRGGMELVLDFLHLNWAKSLIRGISKKLFSYEMHWRDNGVSQDAPPSSTCTERKITTLGDSVQIEMTCSIRGASGNSILTATHVYNIFPNCTLRADVKVTPSDCIRGIPSLPRVGLSFGLHPAFHRVKYFGRGPHENYVDRKSGAQIGTWSTSPSKMGFDYIVPSENGSRSDCRWASFESDIGGLIVSADSNCELFSFSALLHTNHELHTASHTNDLDQRKDGEHPIFVNIDNRCMGLGGDVR